LKKISVPARRWYDNQETQLSFPAGWQVDNLTSPGLEKKSLTTKQIKERLSNPVDGASLEEMARGKKQAVIVFDDMTRPTPVKDVAPHVLNALHCAGLKREQIRFIWALGSHGTYDMIAARKKLGDEIVENYPVYNHDPFQNTLYAGKTPGGIDLWLNREFTACDLKIGIGCVTAHVHVGFGGGAKIILPGVAGIESIKRFHEHFNIDPSRHGLGNFDNNMMRDECDAAGDIAGLNFKVDCLVNRRGEVASLYAGPFRATHKQGAEEAKDAYGISSDGDYDIVIANTYAKANESGIAMLLITKLLKPDKSGIGVIISDAPEGQVQHYVFGPWGTDYGGWHYRVPSRGRIPSLMKKLIILNPLPTPYCIKWIGHPLDIAVVKTWKQVLAILETQYPGEAKAGVIPDATMQYVRKPVA
jgi:Lactate racemase N-terminal domain